MVKQYRFLLVSQWVSSEAITLMRRRWTQYYLCLYSITILTCKRILRNINTNTMHNMDSRFSTNSGEKKTSTNLAFNTTQF